MELISDGLGIADPSLGKIRSGTGCFYLRYTYMPNILMLPVGTFTQNLNLIIWPIDCLALLFGVVTAVFRAL